MYFSKAFAATLLVFAAQTVHAQDFKITQAFAETRLGYVSDFVNGENNGDDSGFRGRFLNIRLDGQIAEGLTFSYRQRLNKNTNATFFDATDWLHVDWKATERIALSAGKQVVAIGGFEYDRAPIDIYQYSEFCNQIACFQMGVSATFSVTEKDNLLLQVCNSPFRDWAGSNTYAYNLMWNGSHGPLATIWSVNMLQNGESDWMTYIALGNKLTLGNRAFLELDFMNRSAKGHSFLLKDWSVMTELSLKPSEGSRWYAKYTHDENKSGSDADHLVVDGTVANMLATGLEISPLKDNRDALRLYATCGYRWYAGDANPFAPVDNHLQIEAGFKLKIAKK